MNISNMSASRERLLTVLKGDIPDRVPVSPFVQDEYLAFYYPGKTSVDRVIDAVELSRELEFDLIAKHREFETPHFLKKNYPDWELCQSECRKDNIKYIQMTITTPVGELMQIEAVPEAGTATSGVFGTITKHLLSSKEDVEMFFEYVPEIDDQIVQEMHGVASEWQRVVGDDAILAPWGWAGVFNAAATLRGIEDLMVEPYTDESFYKDFMQRIADLQCTYNSKLAETGIDCIGIQGHMANSRTVSPDYFRDYVSPYEKRVISAIHENGKYSVYHNCGFARSLYAQYRELNMSVWETVSHRPQGDNDLAEAKSEIGDVICLLGNLDQIEFLKTATPSEVEAKTREIVAAGKPGGRFIFSTSDFLEKNTPLANIEAMIRAAKAEGIY
jgi:uroporphyrinogen decarboxylase